MLSAPGKLPDRRPRSQEQLENAESAKQCAQDHRRGYCHDIFRLFEVRCLCYARVQLELIGKAGCRFADPPSIDTLLERAFAVCRSESSQTAFHPRSAGDDPISDIQRLSGGPPQADVV